MKRFILYRVFPIGHFAREKSLFPHQEQPLLSYTLASGPDGTVPCSGGRTIYRGTTGSGITGEIGIGSGKANPILYTGLSNQRYAVSVTTRFLCIVATNNNGTSVCSAGNFI